MDASPPVTTYWEIKRFEEEQKANESTYWLFFRIALAGVFRFVARSHGAKIFRRGGYGPESPPVDEVISPNPGEMEKWSDCG